MQRIIISVILLNLFIASAQNVIVNYNFVPNPGFEEYEECPNAFSQLDKCAKWKQTTSGTADYLNACYQGLGNVGIPDNYMGYQEAHGGNAYAGIICYSTSSVFDYKEYVSVKLKKQLINGYTYKVSFYVSLAEKVSSYYIRNIGAVVTGAEPGYDYMYSTIKHVPDPILPDDFVSTTSQWYLIEGFFVAENDMKYLTIGNFTETFETDAVFYNPNGEGFAYYFIDDVSLNLVLDESEIGNNYGNGYDLDDPGQNAYSEDGYDYDVIIPNVITPNNDNVNDEFFVKYTGYIGSEMTIVDRWGRTVYKTDKFLANPWYGQNSVDGVYFYALNMRKIDGSFDQFTGSIQVIGS